MRFIKPTALLPMLESNYPGFTEMGENGRAGHRWESHIVYYHFFFLFFFGRIHLGVSNHQGYGGNKKHGAIFFALCWATARQHTTHNIEGTVLSHKGRMRVTLDNYVIPEREKKWGRGKNERVLRRIIQSWPNSMYVRTTCSYESSSWLLVQFVNGLVVPKTCPVNAYCSLQYRQKKTGKTAFKFSSTATSKLTETKRVMAQATEMKTVLVQQMLCHTFFSFGFVSRHF